MRIAQKTIALFITALILTSGAISVRAEDLNYNDASRLVSEGKLDEARAILNKVISSNSEDIAALSLLGEVYRKKHDYKNALKFLNKAIAADQGYPLSYMYKGKLYFGMQKFEEVAAEFNLFMDNMKPLIMDEDTKNFYISSLHDISTIYFELKNYEEFRAVVNEILRLSPKDQTALYNLGVYYYVSERNRSRAYSYFSKAVDIDSSTSVAVKARYAIEFMRANSDPRIEPDFSFIDQEYRD